MFFLPGMKREANLHFAQDFAAHATRRLGNFRNLEERVPWVLGAWRRGGDRGVLGGGLPLDLFPQTPPNFFLPTQAVRTIAHPSGESAPESPSHAELCSPVWTAFPWHRVWAPHALPRCYFAFVEILEPIWKASSEISGLTRLLFEVFCCFFPRNPARRLGLAPVSVQSF